ncbi:MAG: sensor histidine kinase, partial [Chloroflexota bacterium]
MFYAAILTLLMLLLALYLNQQLTTFTTNQLAGRLEARAATFAAPPPHGPGERRGPASPGIAPPRAAGNLRGLANGAANSDTAGVTTTILVASASGGPATAVRPSSPPPAWRAQPNLSQALFVRATADRRATDRPTGPVTVTGPEGSELVLDQPLIGPGKVEAVAQISTPLADVQRLLASFRLALALGIGALFLLALSIGQPLARMALRPLRRFTLDIARISPQRPGERVTIPQPADELRELALTFNQLLDRMEGALESERRVQKQLRRFVGDASHEL